MSVAIQSAEPEQYVLICQDPSGQVLATYTGKGDDVAAKAGIDQIEKLTRLDGEWSIDRPLGRVSHRAGRKSG